MAALLGDRALHNIRAVLGEDAANDIVAAIETLQTDLAAADLASVAAAIADHETRIAATESAIADHETRIAALEAL